MKKPIRARLSLGATTLRTLTTASAPTAGTVAASAASHCISRCVSCAC